MATKTPHFKKKWSNRVWQVKTPNPKKLEFALKCLQEFDDRLSALTDALDTFDRENRKQRFFPLCAVDEEIESLRHSQPALASALETVLHEIYQHLADDSMAFESYLSRCQTDFIRVIMPFLEARWRALSVADRKVICGNRSKGQQGWGKVDDHIKNAAKAVVLCTLDYGETISGLTPVHLSRFVRV